MEELKLPSFCRKGTPTCECEIKCYPLVLLEGFDGKGGFAGSSNIPRKYQNALPENLPIQGANPKTYEMVIRYLTNVTANVRNGVGLYFYSLPTETNPLGTGTGKTTTACTIANYYMRKRIIEHVKKENEITYNPVLFLSGAEFQNTFNSQFSGSFDLKEEAAIKFQNRKQMAMKVELLIMDDIATRGGDTYLNHLFEIIDYRVTEEKPFILTSNVAMKDLTATLGERITSRIDGGCVPLAFGGKDFRKRVF